MFIRAGLKKSSGIFSRSASPKSEKFSLNSAAGA